MWSDPDDKIDTWTPSERGAGWYYGWKAVQQVIVLILSNVVQLLK